MTSLRRSFIALGLVIIAWATYGYFDVTLRSQPILDSWSPRTLDVARASLFEGVLFCSIALWLAYRSLVAKEYVVFSLLIVVASLTYFAWVGFPLLEGTFRLWKIIV